MSAAIAIVAVVARLHDIAAYPAMYDFDAAGHAVNVLDVFEGRLPDLRSWAGSHPPLYYAVGAALWRWLPDGVPVHVILRAISVAAWAATVGLVWRALRRLGFREDAPVVAALLLGVPGMVIASCMMTNDALCAFFVTATVARLLDVPHDHAPATRHALVTGVLAGLAALTKANGITAIAMAVLFYAWRSRRVPRRALGHALAVGGVSLAIAGPHYARLFLSFSGPVYQLFGTRIGSQEKEAIGHLIYAVLPTRRAFRSLAALFHWSLWDDPLAVYLPVATGMARGAMLIGGLVPAALVVIGAVRLCFARALAARAGAALVFGLLYAALLLPLAWIGPYIILTKINYLLPAALPLAVLLAAGLDAWHAGRTVLRVVVLALAAGGIAITWYGGSATPAVALHGFDSAAATRTVERYFEGRAGDPIRAASLLAPEAQLAHGLRVARMLGVSLSPEPDLTPAAEYSLELARARLAWLDVYNLVHWVQPIAAALDVRVLAVDQQRDVATVTVRVSAATPGPPQGGTIGRWPFPSFEQRFTLRPAGDDWQIVDITQSGVVDESAVEAFVAAPTFDGLQRLRALGWRPSWDYAFAAILPPSDAPHRNGIEIQ